MALVPDVGLPGQPVIGEASYFPDGTVLMPFLKIQFSRGGTHRVGTLTGDYQALVDDHGTCFVLDGFTLTLSAAAELENGWACDVIGPGTIACGVGDTFSYGETEVVLSNGSTSLRSDGVDRIENLASTGAPVAIVALGVWSDVVNYAYLDVVNYGTPATSYLSRIANNLDNQPDVSPTQWMVLAGAGSAGADGFMQGKRFTFSTSVVEADPGNGFFRADNSTFLSITKLWFADADMAGNDVTASLLRWGSSTSTDKGELTLQSAADPDDEAIFIVTGVTDEGAYLEVTVTPDTGAMPANGTVMVTDFQKTGTAGDALEASTTLAGKVELATVDEVQAGTDTVRAVTPEGVMNAGLFAFLHQSCGGL